MWRWWIYFWLNSLRLSSPDRIKCHSLSRKIVWRVCLAGWKWVQKRQVASSALHQKDGKCCLQILHLNSDWSFRISFLSIHRSDAIKFIAISCSTEYEISIFYLEWIGMKLDQHFIVAVFHLLLVVPLFLFIGFQRSSTPTWVYLAIFVIGVFIFLYHGFKLVVRALKHSEYAWVNAIHVILVAPLLMYIEVTYETFFYTMVL